MFKLTLHDRKGTELNQGDIVKISNGKSFTFFAEVKFLEDEKVITPFHTFCFHSFEKVDQVPEGAVLSTEPRYKIWYMRDSQAQLDEDAHNFELYLRSWRECERSLADNCFQISLL